LRVREQKLHVREDEQQKDIRLIRSCLHPDKHPQESDRYAKAWQALDRLLTPVAKPDREDFDDNIPF
jgi:hypothetical protein